MHSDAESDEDPDIKYRVWLRTDKIKERSRRHELKLKSKRKTTVEVHVKNMKEHFVALIDLCHLKCVEPTEKPEETQQ